MRPTTNLLALIVLLTLSCGGDDGPSCPTGTTLVDDICLSTDGGARDAGPLDLGPCGECSEGLVCNRALARCTECDSDEDCGPERPLCSNVGSCRECFFDEDCGPEAPLCLLGLCEGCDDDDRCERFHPETPMCDISTGSCWRCEAHSDCPSGLCGNGGACVPADDIAWVDRAEPGCSSGDGSRARPYCEIANAVESLRRRTHVAVLPSADAYTPFRVDARADVHVVGVADGVRVVATSSTTAVAVSDADLTLANLAVVQANTSRDAVTCSTASLTLIDVEIEGSGAFEPGFGDGIFASNCVLEVRRVEVHGNKEDGVRCRDGGSAMLVDVVVHDNGGVGVNAFAAADVTIRRSMVRDNDDGGVALSGARFDIENTVIAENGTMALTGAGGANLTSPVSGSRFVNNTVVYNQTAASLSVGGVLCQSGFELVNTVLFDNEAGTSTSDSLDCTLVDSSEGVDPAFDSDGIHLTSSSDCCIDMADDAAAPDDDIDGEERPCGAGADIGADEFCP